MTTVPPADLFDETALVERARAGDAAAFTELVEKYERKIYRLAKHITQNDEDAEDVLQETFLKAYSHLDSFAGQSKFYTWIVRIAVNEALMKLRKRKSDRTVSLDEPQDTGEETVTPRSRFGTTIRSRSTRRKNFGRSWTMPSTA